MISVVTVQTLQRKSRCAEYRLVIHFRVGKKPVTWAKKMFVVISASGKGWLKNMGSVIGTQFSCLHKSFTALEITV